jgi:hypothetical protein
MPQEPRPAILAPRARQSEPKRPREPWKRPAPCWASGEGSLPDEHDTPIDAAIHVDFFDRPGMNGVNTVKLSEEARHRPAEITEQRS